MESESISPTVSLIEDMLLDLLSQLAGSHSPEDEYMRIALALADRTRTTTLGQHASKTITFARRAARGGSARSLAILLNILDATHEALVMAVPTTKRDIFYRSPDLFKSQSVVDTFVDDLAATLDIDRADLNVRATSKGLFSGSGLSIVLVGGEEIQGNDCEGALIPVGEDIESFRMDSDVSWVLIVEKDAVFQSFLRLNVTNNSSMPGRGLMITGKGYPDVATRHLVKTLSNALPDSIPIMALVDGDAYGLDILSVYKHGSQRLRHQNDSLAAHNVQWLGILSSELAKFDVDIDALLPLTKHDVKKAMLMLQRPHSLMPHHWRKELTRMLFMRRKAEIEILCTGTAGEDIDLDDHAPGESGHHLLLRYLAAKMRLFLDNNAG